jgi:hypothetical protein
LLGTTNEIGRDKVASVEAILVFRATLSATFFFCRTTLALYTAFVFRTTNSSAGPVVWTALPIYAYFYGRLRTAAVAIATTEFFYIAATSRATCIVLRTFIGIYALSTTLGKFRIDTLSVTTYFRFFLLTRANKLSVRIVQCFARPQLAKFARICAFHYLGGFREKTRSLSVGRCDRHEVPAEVFRIQVFVLSYGRQALGKGRSGELRTYVVWPDGDSVEAEDIPGRSGNRRDAHLVDRSHLDIADVLRDGERWRGRQAGGLATLGVVPEDDRALEGEYVAGGDVLLGHLTRRVDIDRVVVPEPFGHGEVVAGAARVGGHRGQIGVKMVARVDRSPVGDKRLTRNGGRTPSLAFTVAALPVRRGNPGTNRTCAKAYVLLPLALVLRRPETPCGAGGTTCVCFRNIGVRRRTGLGGTIVVGAVGAVLATAVFAALARWTALTRTAQAATTVVVIYTLSSAFAVVARASTRRTPVITFAVFALLAGFFVARRIAFRGGALFVLRYACSVAADKTERPELALAFRTARARPFHAGLARAAVGVPAASAVLANAVFATLAVPAVRVTAAFAWHAAYAVAALA